MARDYRFLHECGIKEWLEEDFPSVFTSQEGQRILGRRADEIIDALDGYFTLDYMMISENAQYLKQDIEAIKAAYEKKDYKAMGEALEVFKTAVEWI